MVAGTGLRKDLGIAGEGFGKTMYHIGSAEGRWAASSEFVADLGTLECRIADLDSLNCRIVVEG